MELFLITQKPNTQGNNKNTFDKNNMLQKLKKISTHYKTPTLTA